MQYSPGNLQLPCCFAVVQARACFSSNGIPRTTHLNTVSGYAGGSTRDGAIFPLMATFCCISPPTTASRSSHGLPSAVRHFSKLWHFGPKVTDGAVADIFNRTQESR